MLANSGKQSSLFPILLVNFVGTLGFSIVLPFLVFLVMKFGGDAIVYGLLAAIYPAFQLIGAPLLGRWSDIFGRKNLLPLILSLLVHLSLVFLCLSYFSLELLMALLVGISLLPMHILLTFHPIKLEAKTLEKWLYLPILGLF